MRNTLLHHMPALMRLLAVWLGWSVPTSCPAQAALPPAQASGSGEAVLVVETKPAAPVETGIAELTRVLQGKGLRVARATALATDNRTHIVLGRAGTSPVLDRLLKNNGCAVSRLPESVCIKRLPSHSPPAILIAGSDARGVMYGLLEAARSVELAGRGADPFSGIADAAESPDLAMRSVSLSLYNADLEREWYFKEEFWRAYLAMLAGNRFNNFTLVFANQTSYLNPPYPFLVEVPEHPEVRAIGVSGQERQRNLDRCCARSQAWPETMVLTSRWASGCTAPSTAPAWSKESRPGTTSGRMRRSRPITAPCTQAAYCRNAPRSTVCSIA